MSFRFSRRSKAADASSIYDARFTIYDPPVDHMKRQLTITAERIDEAALLSKRRISDGMGAVVCFLGMVRGTEEDRAISAIEYEAFLRMAEHQFDRLFDQMEKRWPIESVRLVHRIGVVAMNEPSLWVAVVGPHRGEAFTAR